MRSFGDGGSGSGRGSRGGDGSGFSRGPSDKSGSGSDRVFRNYRGPVDSSRSWDAGKSKDSGERFRNRDFDSGARSGNRDGGRGHDGDFRRRGDHDHDHHHGHHRRDHFVFFFGPLFLHGYGFPYSYYDDYYAYAPLPYADPYPAPYPYLGPTDPGIYAESLDTQTEPQGGFKPNYGNWAWSAEGGYHWCPYYLAPETVLWVITYPNRLDVAYFFDPKTRQYIGVFTWANGEFFHWYKDEQRWSESQPFQFAAPPAPPKPSS